MKRLAVITTHPIQYNAPLFKLLAARGVLQIKVFYTWGEKVLTEKYDPGFGKTINWDIPLLEGYEYSFVKNVSLEPGSHHFKGIINPSLNEEVKAWGADAVLVYGWSFKSHLKCLRYFYKKVPVLFRGDSILESGPGILKQLFKKKILSWIYKHVNKALYVGTRNKQYFLQCNMRENQLVFAPHAIDNQRFKTAEENSEYNRRTLNIPKEAIVFLFAGKLEPKKNVELLLKAFKKIGSEHVYLIIAGDGVLEKTLKKVYGELPYIIFIPFQNQSKMPALYMMADVFVLPSQGPCETWGLAVNEAMASSKTVLVSDACGCAPDLVRDGINGYIFKSNDENDLLLKIQMLLADKEKLFIMGQASAEIIHPWTFENICIVIEQTMEKS